ncbi:glycosyltransferase [Burkholderia singularis]|uniref:Glycosyl transferase, family 2 n=1 Tax=Burkholderia singularis TaxID=1503053 RepID=A0A238H8E9_9BURK|nr:glycosyltransferase [Burkholderia singularis]SMG01307.1 Glycosyl transferase, family 2 [Burkholderia singularis]
MNEVNPLSPGLSVSIVVYQPDMPVLASTLVSLCEAVAALRAERPDLAAHVYLIDNGGLPRRDVSSLWADCDCLSFSTISGHGNVGYGRGHNLVLDRLTHRYHLVLNPDIDLRRDALIEALNFLDAHADVGLLTPCIDDENGGIQYLCRRYPTLFGLFLRGFAPSWLAKPFSRRLARYEMRDVINRDDVVWEPPIVSGCFMLFSTDVLRRLGGFDPRYFLYFEDYDLSLRAHSVARVAYVPQVRVVHHGGGAAKKGLTHVKLFVASAFKFFKRFGWRLA